MKIEFCSQMKESTSLPSNYSSYTILAPLKELRLIIVAVITGIVLLLMVGWLLVIFVNELRPTALEGMRIRDMLNSTTTGTSFVIPPAVFRNLGLALIAVLILHESVHGLFYWLFSCKRPKLGFQGLFPYAAAPSGVYFTRNRFIIIGLSPLILLTGLGLFLMGIVPNALVPFLLLFVAFNAAGATGDLIMVSQFMRFSSDTFMEDNGSDVIIYKLKESR